MGEFWMLTVRTLTAVAVLALVPSAVMAQETPPPPPPAETAPTPPPAETPPAATETAPAAAQQTPADPNAQKLPEVQVIQKKQEPESEPAPQKKVTKKKPSSSPASQAAQPKPKPQPATEPEPLPPQEPDVVEQSAPAASNSVYGSPASTGAAARADQSATTPVNPGQIIPTNLDGFSSAATGLSSEELKQNQPRNVNEALTRVPGVIVINDDANAHHGGIALRGSPARRSRKLLVMEDGHQVNLALWLDPSVHFWGPADRFESIEVLRGTVITHGPNNNFGVVNARNISPFGAAETVIGASIGFTETDRGFFINEDGERVDGDDQTDLSYRWHVHTRQHSGNVGLVASYTGANVQGSWDTEQLRFNDFYGAIGWKGSNSDVVVSSSYSRQRDDYDEQNFLGEREVGEILAGAAADEEEAGELAEELFADANVGFAEQQFRNLKHCKTCFAGASGINNFNGDIWRGQIVHNAYIDDDITITSRIYGGFHRRDRYQLNAFDSDPDGSGGGLAPVISGTEFEDGIENTSILFGADSMFGRLRTFRHAGAEIRGEWANRNILGFNQAIQAGLRYEYNDLTNVNIIGRQNEILRAGDESGFTIFDRELDSNAVSAFVQTNIDVASNLNVVPGVRFEWYQASRINRVIAREESEAGGGDEADCNAAGFGDECLELDGIVLDPTVRSESFDNFSALPGVSFAYTGFHRTTVFGGYHRGLSTGVLRNEDFPVEDEIGNNFNLGFRTTAIKGLDFEAVGFYQLLENYQFGASFSDAADRSFGRADEVEISGVELYGRLNSQPFTGGSFNVFGEANYTYSRGIFTDLEVDGENFDGNRIPEVPLHVAALTLGVEQRSGWRWDASVTYTYRGAFFTDEGNTAFGAGGEFECEQEAPGDNFECEVEEAGEDGEVPDIWLLSARFNMDIGDTGASIFVAGDNLTNEFYITDREDGIKPGVGRTFWTGFKYEF